MIKISPAYRERDDLNYYTQVDALLLTNDKVLSEARERDYKRAYIYQTIGCLAANFALIGEDRSAINLAERLLDEVGADENGILETWSTVADNGAKIADNRLREAMGLTLDEHGNTLLSKEVNMKDSKTFYRLLSLYKFGDKSIAPYLHQFIEGLGDVSTPSGVRLAVRVYEAGDESAYDLIKNTAERARTYAFSQPVEEKEITADDASDLAQAIQGISRALSPSRSETERHYGQADSALKFFARDLIKRDELKRASEIQSLMLSRFDNACVNAYWFENGHDTNGRYRQAAKDYLAVYGEDSDHHCLEIVNSLVRGGDPEAVEEYQTIYDPKMKAEDIDTHAVADSLVALHKSGDTKAHDRLVEFLQDPEDSWKLIRSLAEMGFDDEAAAIALKEFKRRPTYETALTLLTMQYDYDAMEIVQDGVGKYDRELIDVVYSRARILGKLATHINTLERS
jgi:hypothetical protein